MRTRRGSKGDDGTEERVMRGRRKGDKERKEGDEGEEEG